MKESSSAAHSVDVDSVAGSGSASAARDALPSAEAACRLLGQLAPGDQIRLCDHAGKTATGRLADLGLVPGTVVGLVRHAPLGDPLEIELRGFRLCVRAADVAQLCGQLETLPPDGARS